MEMLFFLVFLETRAGKKIEYKKRNRDPTSLTATTRQDTREFTLMKDEDNCKIMLILSGIFFRHD